MRTPTIPVVQFSLIFLALFLGDAEAQVPSHPISSEFQAGYDFDLYVPARCGYHLAEDFIVEAGTPVRATLPGSVVYSKNMSGLGHALILDHQLDDDIVATSVYYHLQQLGEGGISRELGEEVGQGEVVGYVSGRWVDHMSVPHLHFGVRRGEFVPAHVNDLRTNLWHYPGYSTVRLPDANGNLVKQCDSSGAIPPEIDAVQRDVVADWYEPSEFLDGVFGGSGGGTPDPVCIPGGSATPPEPGHLIANGTFTEASAGWTVCGDAWIGLEFPQNAHGSPNSDPGYSSVGVGTDGSHIDHAEGVY